jgi:hypothetical protein
MKKLAVLFVLILLFVVLAQQSYDDTDYAPVISTPITMTDYGPVVYEDSADTCGTVYVDIATGTVDYMAFPDLIDNMDDDPFCPLILPRPVVEYADTPVRMTAVMQLVYIEEGYTANAEGATVVSGRRIFDPGIDETLNSMAVYLEMPKEIPEEAGERATQIFAWYDVTFDLTERDIAWFTPIGNDPDHYRSFVALRGNIVSVVPAEAPVK